MATKAFSIHGVTVNLTAHNDAFMSFAAQYLRGFESEHHKQADINVSVAFLPGSTFKTEHSSYSPHTLGTGLGWDSKNNTLYTNAKGIESRITLTEPWHAEVRFQKNFFRHLANKLFFAGAKTETNYYRAIIRQILQQLVFMQLANRWNIIALSGAAVKMGNRAFVFAGLPGSGKSTLVQALKKELGAEILAENFVLTDGERLFPFSEGACADITPVAINKIYVLTHGEQFAQYQLPREQAYQALKAINLITAELPEQSAYAALLLVDPTRWQFLFDSDNETLKKLCERHACERLVVDEGLEKTLTHLKIL